MPAGCLFEEPERFLGVRRRPDPGSLGPGRAVLSPRQVGESGAPFTWSIPRERERPEQQLRRLGVPAEDGQEARERLEHRSFHVGEPDALRDLPSLREGLDGLGVTASLLRQHAPVICAVDPPRGALRDKGQDGSELGVGRSEVATIDERLMGEREPVLDLAGCAPLG